MATEFLPYLEPIEKFTPGVYLNAAGEGDIRFAIPIFLSEGEFSGRAVVFGGAGNQFVEQPIVASRSFRIREAAFTTASLLSLSVNRSALQEGCLGPIAGSLALLCRDHFGDAEWLFLDDGLFHDLRDNRFYFDSWQLTAPSSSDSNIVLFEKQASASDSHS